jgi:hypothetical protein
MSFINQKSYIENIINEYPFTIQYGMEKTTSVDGEYDTPEYFKTFSDAYYYLVNKIKHLFGDIELDKKYEKTTGYYYLLSYKKAQELNSESEFQYIYKTPDNGIIYYGIISKSNINNIFNNDIILIKKRLQLIYFGLYKTSKSILINDISTNIECINHMYPGIGSIGVLSNKWVDYKNNMTSSSLYEIINNYLSVYDIPLICNIDDFINKLLKFQIKYLGFDDFAPTKDIVFQELIITSGANFNFM